jgi:hypothetical protein
MADNSNDVPDRLKAHDFHQGAPAGERLSQPILDKAALEEFLNRESPKSIDGLEHDKRILEKMVGQLARDLADEKLRHLGKEDLKAYRYELIDRCYQRYKEFYTKAVNRKAKVDDEIIPEFIRSVAFAGESIGRTTVHEAKKFMEEKREAEAAREPARFTMTPQAEAKAKEFKAIEPETKAKAKAKFYVWLARTMWIKSWLRRNALPRSK